MTTGCLKTQQRVVPDASVTVPTSRHNWSSSQSSAHHLLQSTQMLATTQNNNDQATTTTTRNHTGTRNSVPPILLLERVWVEIIAFFVYNQNPSRDFSLWCSLAILLETGSPHFFEFWTSYVEQNLKFFWWHNWWIFGDTAFWRQILMGILVPTDENRHPVTLPWLHLYCPWSPTALPGAMSTQYELTTPWDGATPSSTIKCWRKGEAVYFFAGFDVWQLASGLNQYLKDRRKVLFHAFVTQCFSFSTRCAQLLVTLLLLQPVLTTPASAAHRE